MLHEHIFTTQVKEIKWLVFLIDNWKVQVSQTIWTEVVCFITLQLGKLPYLNGAGDDIR